MTTNRLIIMLFFVPALCFSQGFGFGFDDTDAEETKTSSDSILPFSPEIGGEIEAGMLLFTGDFKDGEEKEKFSDTDIISAKVNYRIAGKSADVYAAFILSADSFAELADGGPASGQTPQIIDEFWVRGYFGQVSAAAGLMKLGWGRMFSPGPLDITNPLNYSDLTSLTDSKAMKIARPMVHVSWNVGDFTKIESVFMPNFQGHRFAQNGRWVPSQFSNMTNTVAGGIFSRALEVLPPQYLMLLPGIYQQVQANFPEFAADIPDTSGLNYFQAGLRFSTTIGPADLGVQHFYGNMFRPSVSVGGIDLFLNDLLTQSPNMRYPSPHIEYSRYHQIGLDYAQVIAGFNVRAELAGHITADTTGDNGAVHNPFLAWSLGFDRDIIGGINVNIQCNETVRLFDDKVQHNPAMDSEGTADITSTRLILQISQQFFRDRLECKVIGIWGIEDRDYHIVPSLAWTINDIRAELSAGIFAGDKEGELGQYWKNNFVKLGLIYSF